MENSIYRIIIQGLPIDTFVNQGCWRKKAHIVKKSDGFGLEHFGFRDIYHWENGKQFYEHRCLSLFIPMVTLGGQAFEIGLHKKQTRGIFKKIILFRSERKPILSLFAHFPFKNSSCSFYFRFADCSDV